MIFVVFVTNHSNAKSGQLARNVAIDLKLKLFSSASRPSDSDLTKISALANLAIQLSVANRKLRFLAETETVVVLVGIRTSNFEGL